MTNREIDALVAEKVMGWKWAERHFGNITIYEWQTPKGNIKQEHWSPSTDIKAAWEVVEKFTPHIRIECCDNSDYVDFDVGKKWHVDIWVDGKEVCCVQADTAPLTICLASLKAKGIEV